MAHVLFMQPPVRHIESWVYLKCSSLRTFIRNMDYLKVFSVDWKCDKELKRILLCGCWYHFYFNIHLRSQQGLIASVDIIMSIFKLGCCIWKLRLWFTPVSLSGFSFPVGMKSNPHLHSLLIARDLFVLGLFSTFVSVDRKRILNLLGPFHFNVLKYHIRNNVLVYGEAK